MLSLMYVLLPTTREGNVLYLPVCSQGEGGRQTPWTETPLNRDPPEGTWDQTVLTPWY